MRSRSNRLPMAEPRHDDWVDGSWTVDCVCGVTFDDGEEMVDCDECGVWVHTRCSRYVKSEKSFACDKCKSKSSAGGGGSGVRNESEETEVAEFLLELPTKTLRMENPNPVAVASRRPFKLRTGIPMEERVHVQGVPGGEPGLFSGNGLSSIFGPQLWKSTGYVPKKFNHKYTEFPFLGQGNDEEKEEEEMDKTNGEKNANRADNGARVLFSLLNKNESNLPTPVLNSASVKGVVERGVHDETLAPRQKKLGGEKSYSAPDDGHGIKKKKSNLVTVVLHSGKRKKEESGTSKDQNVKKKVRTIEKEGYVKKPAVHGPKAASTSLSDSKHLEFSRDRGCKAVNDDRQCSKNLGDQPLDRLGECATNLASNGHTPEAPPRSDISSDKMSRVEKIGVQVPVESENFKTYSLLQSLTEVNGLRSLPLKEEVTGDTLQRCQAGNGSVGNGSCEKESVAVAVAVADVRVSCADARGSEHGQDSETDEANSRPIKKLKSELAADYQGDHPVESLHFNDVKTEGPKVSTQNPALSANLVTREDKVVGTSTSNAEASEAKLLESRIITVARPKKDKTDESACNARISKRDNSESEGSMGAKKGSSGLKPSSEVAVELLKSNGIARSHSTASYQRKAGVSVVRSASTSGIMSKSSENYMAATAQNSSAHSRQELSDSSQGTTKDNPRPRKLVKESSRSGSVKKMSDHNKSPHPSDSKRPSSDSKDPIIHSSKVPLSSNAASGQVSSEVASLPATDTQTKAAASSVPGKGEKSYNPDCNPPSKGHVASMTSPASSNVAAALSDEELALLLHQELNSSPRVPRVPRMRQAGSLPQLNGPTATSMLMKRASSSGGKDQVAARRRSKDLSGESLHAYPEVDSEAKKERKPNSPDNRRKDSSYQLSRKDADGGQLKGLQSMKKTNMNSSVSSSADANGSSRPSARNDDPRMVGRQSNRTLPGLIADIMSEGKRMTYEELCNAVLPHWPHLRKHNGERYAYSSHSQAVLDCLRNRSEWARLVDRGPKTSASRKRRKLDADSMSMESEDNEDEKNSKDHATKSFDSNQEEFPKGKRKARKRGRLALQGRGIVRRLRRADVVSDDESESFSYSSEDSMSSEEEIQGGGTSNVGSDVSASSDEAQ